jgi:vancomycin aglycone glucosyltransferase
MLNFIFRDTINSIRRGLELEPIKNVYEHFLGEDVILECDPFLGPLPSDVRRKVTQTGQWILEDPAEIPEEVERFLQAGPPPVYIGFGSMQMKDEGRGARAITEALRSSKVRAVIGRGWEQLDVNVSGLDAIVVGPLPFEKFLPRCAGAVYHGGVGTVHAVARAGIPHVVVSYLFDQSYWGPKLVKDGLSPATFRRAGLKAEPLAAALRALVEDEAMRKRAQALGRKMLRDGTEKAADLMEAMVGSASPGHLRAPRAP